MCFAKSPEPPRNPAQYAPEDGHKQFAIEKTDEKTGNTTVLQEPQGETREAYKRNKPVQTAIRI